MCYAWGALPHLLPLPPPPPLQEALRLAPRCADAHTGLGMCHKEQGRLAEAEACFGAVVALRPGCALALGNLAGVCYDEVRGGVELGRGEWWGGRGRGEGQGCCGFAVPGGRAWLVQPCSVLPHNHACVQRTLEPAVAPYRSSHPCIGCSNPAPTFQHTHTQGKLEAAIALYRRAISAQPHFPEAHNNLGNALREAGRADEAIAAYTACIQLQVTCASGGGEGGGGGLGRGARARARARRG